MPEQIILTECPRDAMQGMHEWIPTEKKVKYINQLLKSGFNTIDFGSFVSPKAIPQLRDTADVLNQLELDANSPKLLAIVANLRGAEDAVKFEEISYLGFPFSISETFQQRNTNSSIEESLLTVANVMDSCVRSNKELVVYISMGFGNPYEDEWNIEIVEQWVNKLAGMGVRNLSLADTVGVSNPENISYLFKNLIPAFPKVKIGAHLHSTPHNWEEKIDAAWMNGCRYFDSAIKGFGGCPMAKDELVGNIATEKLFDYIQKKGITCSVKPVELQKAMELAVGTFPVE